MIFGVCEILRKFDTKILQIVYLKSFSNHLFIHTSDYLRYLTRKSVIHLPT